MITANSRTWNNFVRHILKWEGKTSSDPRDAAAKCFPGGIHTNKGITFCTFKAMAPKLGITPVTHARFLKLTDAEVGLFIYEFYKEVKGYEFPAPLALAMTEAAWASGSARAFAHLRQAMANAGLPAKTNTQAIDSTRKLPSVSLFSRYQGVRKAYLESLGQSSRFSMFIKGWLNRFNDFNKKFAPTSMFPFFFSFCSAFIG